MISFALDTKLIEDIVYHILSECDVHDGLRCVNELRDQVIMLLVAVAHQEVSLHGVELVPSLDLCHGQRHRRAMLDAMEGDLLDAGQNVVEAGVDEGASSNDGICGYVRR